MNNRRSFLKNLGGLLGAVIIAPNILKEPEKINIEKLAFDLPNLTSEDNELTNQFFHYLETHKVYFEWERVHSPWFKVEINDPLERVTRLAPLNKTKTYVAEFVKVPVEYYPNKVHNSQDEIEYRNTIFGQICDEICNGTCCKKEGKKYFHYLVFTPVIYDPFTFEPLRGILIRGVL